MSSSPTPTTITINQTNDCPSFSCLLTLPPQGSGPGIIFINENYKNHPKEIEQQIIKLSEEGYVVILPILTEIKNNNNKLIFYIKNSISYLNNNVKEKIGKIGIIGTGNFGYDIILKFSKYLSNLINCAIIYYPTNLNNEIMVNDDNNKNNLKNLQIPFVIHLINDDDNNDNLIIYNSLKNVGNVNKFFEIYDYPNVKYGFDLDLPGNNNNNNNSVISKSAAGMAYSRSLTVLKKTIGPLYNLSAVWEEHLKYEFETRDVKKTMETMVPNPYVNNIPTVTGGIGYEHLARFYSNPPDTRIIPISRTIGVDRMVDEMLFSFTHTQSIEWILPGVPPTNKFVEIPLVAIVNFRGDKLCNEHIYWDQASVLVQVGLLNKEGLPVTGAEQSRKVFDDSIPSNQLISDWNETLKKGI